MEPIRHPFYLDAMTVASRGRGLIPAALMKDRFLKCESMRFAPRPNHRTGQQSGRMV